MYAHQMGIWIKLHDKPLLCVKCHVFLSRAAQSTLLALFPEILQQILRQQHPLCLMRRGGLRLGSEGPGDGKGVGFGQVISHAPPLALPAVGSSVRFVVACLPWEQLQTSLH